MFECNCHHQHRISSSSLETDSDSPSTNKVKELLMSAGTPIPVAVHVANFPSPIEQIKRGKTLMTTQPSSIFTSQNYTQVIVKRIKLSRHLTMKTHWVNIRSGRPGGALSLSLECNRILYLKS